MRRQQFRGDERGMAPVVGVVLILALTMILVASLGTFVMNTADEEIGVIPAVGFSAAYDDATDTLTIRHESGDAFARANVRVARHSGSGGALVATWSSTTVAAGDQVELGGVASDDVILVVWEEPIEGGKSTVLYTWRGPQA